MQDPNQKPLDLPPDDDGIPAFLRREVTVVNSEKEVVPMVSKNDEETVDIADEADEAPAAPVKKPRKAPAKKAASNGAHKPAGKANGKAPVKAASKPAAKPTAKAAPAKGKAKAKVARQRDPLKLDAFGFRKLSIKSRAAAMYAKAKGATLGEVKKELGSVQFNLLTELQANGFKVDKTEVKGEKGRVLTRYKIHAKG